MRASFQLSDICYKFWNRLYKYDLGHFDLRLQIRIAAIGQAVSLVTTIRAAKYYR